MRVAIYAAPGTHSPDPVARQLKERAEAWIGRSVDGAPVVAVEPAVLAGVPDLAALTTQARRYGFHATLKAPFRLAPGHLLDELDRTVARFVARHRPVFVPQLALTRLGSFFALVPGRPAPDLDALAHDVVVAFDDFRAPAAEAEVARRDPAALTPPQRELLLRYGYPYVLEEFRFHLTLTDRVPPPEQPRVEAAARHWFADVLGRDVPLDLLAVFTEAAPGEPFALHSTHRFTPARSTGPAAAATSGGRR